MVGVSKDWAAVPAHQCRRCRGPYSQTTGGSINLRPRGGGNFNLEPESYDIIIAKKQLQFSGPGVSATTESAAESTGTCTVSRANDSVGKVTVTTSGSGISTGAACTINFSRSFNSPVCIVTATNSNAGSNATQTYLTTTSGRMTLNFGSAGGSAYTYSYHCFDSAN